MVRKALLALGGLGALALILWWLLPAQAADRGGGHRPTTLVGPELLLEVPWGSAGASLGRRDGDESAPEGPMSFVTSPDGGLLVLDQVNQRVVELGRGGALRRQIRLPADTYQDLGRTASGHLVVLDRLARSALLVLDPTGQAISEHPIVGDGIAEGGGVTAMFVRDDGVWLEFGHTHTVQVLDAGLRPAAPRRYAQGRIYEPGRTNLSAALDHRGGARIWLERVDDGAVLRGVDARFDHPIARIAQVDRDRVGNLHALFHLQSWDPDDPRRVAHEEVVGVVYDPGLRPIATLRSPWVIRHWEQFKEFEVTPAGDLVQMAFTDAGVRFLRWRWAR